jgi:lysyl-tRNA synthetase class 2
MSSVETSQNPSSLEQQRRINRQTIESLGFDPYGSRAFGLRSIRSAAASFYPIADEDFHQNSKTPGFIDQRPIVKIAGRVVLLRDNGKLIWFNLRDDTGDIQIGVSKKDCDENSFALAKATDLADLLIVEGRITKTKTGELTVWATQMWPAAKSLVPPPEKFAGLTDIESRYRQRYVDFWANPESLEKIKIRSRIMHCIRRFLGQENFLEVETPVLQTLAGGAAARPFATHMNALDLPLFMRIAPELFLKRLLVGGLPRVYEFSRNFRNEGVDRDHNPEFTVLEVYQAYGDMESMMGLTETIVRRAAEEASTDGSMRIQFGEHTIDYGPPFCRVSYEDLFSQALGFSMFDRNAVRFKNEVIGNRITNEQGQDVDHWLLVNALFEEFAEPWIIPTRPTFVTHYPSALSPLTKPNASNPEISDRADLFIGGMEMAPMYTELNNPDIQEAKFREQLSGLSAEEATFRTLDNDFIRALKVGMPPAGGMGIGIDRLVMLLTNSNSIRDVLAFPLMRPE